MKVSHQVAICCLCVFIMSSCASPQSKRIENNKSEFLSYPLEQQKLIKEGVIEPGFTAFQVYLALGDPYYTRVTEESWERWAYLSSKTVTNSVALSNAAYRERCHRKVSGYLAQNEHRVQQFSSENSTIARSWRAYGEGLGQQCDGDGEYIRRSPVEGVFSFEPPSRDTTEFVTTFFVRRYLHFHKDKFTHFEILPDPIVQDRKRYRVGDDTY